MPRTKHTTTGESLEVELTTHLGIWSTGVWHIVTAELKMMSQMTLDELFITIWCGMASQEYGKISLSVELGEIKKA